MNLYLMNKSNTNSPDISDPKQKQNLNVKEIYAEDLWLTEQRK